MQSNTGVAKKTKTLHFQKTKLPPTSFQATRHASTYSAKL